MENIKMVEARDFENSKSFIRKPEILKAIKIEEPFQCRNNNSVVIGDAGMYACLTASNEMIVVQEQFLAQYYEEVK